MWMGSTEKATLLNSIAQYWFDIKQAVLTTLLFIQHNSHAQYGLRPTEHHASNNQVLSSIRIWCCAQMRAINHLYNYYNLMTQGTVILNARNIVRSTVSEKPFRKPFEFSPLTDCNFHSSSKKRSSSSLKLSLVQRKIA